MLVTIMVVVMGKLISSKQSTFLKGMQLVDGMLALNEVLDFAKVTKRKCFVFQIDYEKAYDSAN